jgi:hypothetical protein
MKILKRHIGRVCEVVFDDVGVQHMHDLECQ